MKIGTIITPNTKGQIVIPKKMRDQLGIDDTSPLNIVIRDQGVYVRPIKTVLTTDMVTDKSAYLAILKKTQGTWGGFSGGKRTRTLANKWELDASKRRKKAW